MPQAVPPEPSDAIPRVPEPVDIRLIIIALDEDFQSISN